MKKCITCLWSLMCVVFVQAEVNGQCYSGWISGPLPPPPTGGGTVSAMIVGDPDGAGPEPSQLIVGAGGAVYTWDGLYWHDRGRPGGFLASSIKALVIYDGKLIAGGDFNDGIAWWGGGTSWAILGGGVNSSFDSESVNALAIFGGDLIAGGAFSEAGGIYSPHIARWNGSSWQTMGSPPLGEGISALQPFNNLLYAGGFGTGGSGASWSVLTWNGSNWFVSKGGGFKARSLTVHNGELYVGGESTVENTVLVQRQTGNPASWVDVGVGVGPGTSVVRALTSWNGRLVAGGDFTTAGVYPALHIAFWDGLQWLPTADGLGGCSALDEVRALSTYNGVLIAGGRYNRVGNAADCNAGLPVSNIAQWNGTAWVAMPAVSFVHCTIPFSNRLVMGGQFTRNQFGEPRKPLYIGAWSGILDDITEFGEGVDGPVRALTTYSTGGAQPANWLVAGGDFTSADGGISGWITANRIAQWRESTFAPPAWQAMGPGFNNIVLALTMYNGNVVAGGAFTGTSSGGTTLNRIAKWTGSPASWQPLTGVDVTLNGAVYALKAFDTNFGANKHLLIGGAFTTSTTGVADNRILQRTESTTGGSWIALGAGFDNGAVYSIERHNNNTYAAGSFTQSNGLQLNRIARWNGTSWVAVGIGGSGGGFNGPVYALRTSGGFLYAAGDFTVVDGVAANRIARWNGTAWSSVDWGMNAAVTTLQPYQTELIAGGLFTTVDQPPVPAPGVARFLQSGSPWIARQPASQLISCGQVAVFQIVTPPGYSGLSYAWYKDGEPLVNGPTGFGSSIVGSTNHTLNVTAARLEDAGSYSCVVSNACGSATNTAASLEFDMCCPGDINNDGIVNVQDLLLLLARWGVTYANAADINGDGQVNVTDLLALLAAWGGCS